MRLPEVSFATELTVGRIREAQSSSVSPRNLVLTVIPEVESRIDEILKTNVLSSDFAPTVVGQFLIAEKLETYFQTWNEREKLLKALLNFSAKGTSIGQDFRVLLDARNALMHGNGRLTSHQTKSFNSLLHLKANLSKTLGIELDGDRLLLEGMDRSKTCTIAITYLVQVDQAALSAR